MPQSRAPYVIKITLCEQTAHVFLCACCVLGIVHKSRRVHCRPKRDHMHRRCLDDALPKIPMDHDHMRASATNPFFFFFFFSVRKIPHRNSRKNNKNNKRDISSIQSLHRAQCCQCDECKSVHAQRDAARAWRRRRRPHRSRSNAHATLQQTAACLVCEESRSHSSLCAVVQC
jgi:hypothetical protein